MSNVNSEKLSSARFAEATDAFVEEFTASVGFDQRMALQDIQGSLAHATMLHKIGILTEQELADIRSGLAQIRGEIERGEFVWSIKQEDVHMNIEARLTDLIGIAGKNCTPDVRVTIRSPPTFVCICATKSTSFWGNCGVCKPRCWIWQNARPRRSCPVSPICRWPSR